MISIFDARALRAHCDRCGIPGRVLRRFLGSVFKAGFSPWSEIPGVAERERSGFEEVLAPLPVRVVERRDSRVDGASKVIFVGAAGLPFESVILRFPSGRTTLCLSSQVGCVLRCAFCATGQMADRADLCPEEILGQVLVLAEVLRREGRRIDNVVFMGMGEPLLNEESVCSAIEGLTSGELFNLADRSVLVSTVGLPDAMRRFHRRFPSVNLALSLHSSRDEVRARIMPIARKVRLAKVREVLAELAATRRRGVMIEYLGFDGVNDSDEDMDHLAAFLGDLPCHVNLIPYNSIPAAGFAPHLVPTADDRLDAMAVRLREHGFAVTRRHSLGRDIDAACGQLIQRRELADAD